MSRIEPIGPDTLDKRQRAYWDSVVSGPRGAALGPSPRSLGALFDAWLLAPHAGNQQPNSANNCASSARWMINCARWLR